MADTKEFDVEQIKGGQSMDRQDRQYFERHGAAMSGQAEALAEQYDIDPKEMNDTFDTLMESLIYNSFGNCKRFDEENITEIEEMLDGVCRALMDRYEYTGVTEEQMLSGILQALKQNRGTCFCCMVLNPEWENLPTEYDYVDDTFREEPMMSGIDRVLFADSHQQFNGREGINMMSMLFCRYGGGTNYRYYSRWWKSRNERCWDRTVSVDIRTKKTGVI